MSYRYIIFIFLFLGPLVIAQNEQALNNADYIWQSNLTNPAVVPQGKRIVVALPGAYANLSTPVPLGEYIVTRNEKRILDVWSPYWVDKLKEFNTIQANIQALSFAVSVPIKKRLRINVYHQVVSNALFDFSKDAASIIYNGNEAYIGKSASLYNLINMDVRSELGLGIAYQMSNLSIGVRIKSQNGMMGAFTQNEKINLTTDSENYGLNLESDYKLQTFAAGKGFNELFLRNRGYSIDWGFKLKWENYEFSGSYLDIASKIMWKQNSKSYTLEGQHVFYGFRSIDLQKTTFHSFTDTLQNALEIRENKNDSYKQEINPRIYFSLNRVLSDNVRLGINFFMQGETKKVTEGVSIGAMFTATTTQLWNFLDLGITAGSRSGTNNLDIGLHGAANIFNKAQIYFVTDNIISYILPTKAKAINGRLGINLLFGKEDDHPTVKAKKKKKFKLKIKKYWYSKKK